MLALAGRTADVVALGASPYADEREYARMAALVREGADGRAADVVLNVNLTAVGDALPPWLEQRMGVTLDKLAAADAAGFLQGSPREMADTLLRRREATGISYICAGVDHADQLAPVVELLRGG